MGRSEQLFEEAVRYIPGGVNSPVRAFGNVHGVPRFIRSARGAYMTDEDGKTYLDYVGSWGPMILGHNPPQVQKAVQEACEMGLSFGAATRPEVEMAKMICEMVPSVEMVRMVNSGTEAVMSAIRAARGFTGRDKIIKFAGCYHGHSDALLVMAGSGAMTAGIPNSPGVPKGCTKDTLTAPYNCPEAVEELFDTYPDQIAAVIVEPVGANMGVVLPKEGFLENLRSLCTRHGALLIFDEVITGFRLGCAGAQERFGIRPDLTTYGKIIGGGMPVGAYGGRKDIRELVAPAGPVYQAGTLSGNPVAMAAGMAQLRTLRDHPEIYDALEAKGQMRVGGLKLLLSDMGLMYQVNSIGSIGSLFFTGQPVTDDASAKTSDTEKYARWFHRMLERGIYLAPAQFEAMFVSSAHTEEEIARTLQAAGESLFEL